ncbi:PadR family transcriptional regulator [Nonomuraea sp. NPDC050536]|uniref:PadR family transcriptional regulator n=1 Tax=Nonomuraea sp. NPDC050536 TaxID=3364366 RepID=UPI0037CA56A5
MSLRMALLGLLEVKGPASGYDLAKSFERSLNHVWQAGHTQIYPELVKMDSDGLIAVQSEGARGRKIYAITQEGMDQLRAWLQDRDPAITIRSEIALQAFLLPLLETRQAIDVLERIRHSFAERLSVLECYPDPETKPNFGRFALKLGLAQTRTGLAWAEECLAELRSRL